MTFDQVFDALLSGKGIKRAVWDWHLRLFTCYKPADERALEREAKSLLSRRWREASEQERQEARNLAALGRVDIYIVSGSMVYVYKFENFLTHMLADDWELVG